MGSDTTEAADAPPSPQSIKVHLQTCTELIKFVSRASKILPEIEASRPRCSSGLESLCIFNNAIVTAKSILQYCSESSKLYLALTGDAILSRCKKSTKLLEQSLSEMQYMVPVMLAAEISLLVADLRGARFSLEPSEEEAGNVLKDLLHEYMYESGPTTDNTLKSIRVAMLMLNITTPKALLIEKRSIRSLLDKVNDSEQSKKKILYFFLNLLNKYAKRILKDKSDYDSVPKHEDPLPTSNEEPPDELRCPISSRLMYDPVVIASGETYERMWIQRWFDEGHATCPKTGKTLSHFSLTPNNSMKDLISKWCAKSGAASSKPNMRAVRPDTWEISSVSIDSLGSSMNDLRLPSDFTNSSLGSSDSLSPTSPPKYANVISPICPLESLYGLELLSWESQSIVVKNVEEVLKHEDADQGLKKTTCYEKFVGPLMRFLNNAHESQDGKAQILGCQLLSTFLKKFSSSATRCLDDNAYELLVSFLTTEASREALSILETLSSYNHCQYKIAASCALGLIDMLNSENRDLLETSFKIIYNLSGNDNIRPLFEISKLIQGLVPLFKDTYLARQSLSILKNLCSSEDARLYVAKTDGCFTSVVKVLESDDAEDQEHALAVLLSLCSQRSQYRELVMSEGGIPDLFSISINGSTKGKMMASELLRILRDEFQEAAVETTPPDIDVVVYGANNSMERGRELPAKGRGILGKLFYKISPAMKRKK
ncbi:unnamed protein product [Cuscuta europaea]|uniref:RING-type E3 ubiquitin transferase n=1 Tax=Cuscuta europaea TaxID=41803 RepID=A0A9P0YL67_CUSEU|nr:unnamed protein product [Cuscuta europaea]